MAMKHLYRQAHPSAWEMKHFEGCERHLGVAIPVYCLGDVPAQDLHAGSQWTVLGLVTCRVFFEAPGAEGNSSPMSSLQQCVDATLSCGLRVTCFDPFHDYFGGAF